MLDKTYFGVRNYNYNDLENGYGQAGIFKFEQGIGILELLADSEIGIKNIFRDNNNKRVIKEAPIYGIVDNNKKITIYKPTKTRRSVSTISKEVYKSKYVFFDGWFESFVTLNQFQGVRLYLPEVQYRTNLGGFFLSKPNSESEQIVKYNKDDINLGTSGPFSIGLSIRGFSDVNFFDYRTITNGNSHYRSLSDFQLYNQSFIFLNWNTDLDFDSLSEIIEKCLRFFSYIFGYKVVPDKILYMPVINKSNPTRPLVFQSNESRVYSEYKKDPQLLFLYDDLKDTIPDIMANWLNIYETYPHLIDLYFATLYNKYLHLENTFLNYVQALEGFFDSINNQNTQEFKSMEKQIKEELENIKMKLRSDGGRFSFVDNLCIDRKSLIFVKKIEWISKYVDYEFKLSIRDNPIETIKNIRNMLSHGGGGSHRNEFNQKLHIVVELVDQMKLVMELLMLKALGIPENLYKKIQEFKTKEFNSSSYSSV